MGLAPGQVGLIPLSKHAVTVKKGVGLFAHSPQAQRRLSQTLRKLSFSCLLLFLCTKQLIFVSLSLLDGRVLALKQGDDMTVLDAGSSFVFTSSVGDPIRFCLELQSSDPSPSHSAEPQVADSVIHTSTLAQDLSQELAASQRLQKRSLSPASDRWVYSPISPAAPSPSAGSSSVSSAHPDSSSTPSAKRLKLSALTSLLLDLPMPLLFKTLDYLDESFLCVSVSSVNKLFCSYLSFQHLQGKYWIQRSYLQPQFVAHFLFWSSCCFSFPNVRTLTLSFNISTPTLAKHLALTFPSLTQLRFEPDPDLPNESDDEDDSSEPWIRPLLWRSLSSFTLSLPVMVDVDITYHLAAAASSLRSLLVFCETLDFVDPSVPTFPSLKTLTALETLSLRGAFSSDQLGEALMCLSQLRSLTLECSHDDLVLLSSDPFCRGALPSLTHLDLMHFEV